MKDKLMNILYKLMDYRIIYKIMPKYMKFIYCFDTMLKNKSGCLHLGNGYELNFETMMIDCVSSTESDIHDTVWNMIHKISNIRASYNCFNEEERPKYHACSQAIKALRELIGEGEAGSTTSNIDKMLSIVEEWKHNSDVVSCDAVINMLKANK